MTIHHTLSIGVEVVFFYALWLFLVGITYILMDQFTDWYAQFKQARKDKAAKVAAPRANEQSNTGGKS